MRLDINHHSGAHLLQRWWTGLQQLSRREGKVPPHLTVCAGSFKLALAAGLLDCCLTQVAIYERKGAARLSRGGKVAQLQAYLHHPRHCI